MAKDALIVGAPRSGTSLAASILAGVGYYVGPISQKRHRLGDDHNPFGYFEADEVVERNADVLRHGGYPFHNTWTFDAITAECSKKIASLSPAEVDRLFVSAHREESPWLWKDPRLCFTLPYWWKLLDPDRTVIYLTTRDAGHAYPSFRRKGWCGGGGAERRRVTALVRLHASAARRAVERMQIPHVTVDYAEYGRDPIGVARRISAAFEIDVTPDDLHFHSELDHSGLRGRISGHVRRQLKRLPRKPVERAAVLVPSPLMGLLFPERRYIRASTERGTRHPTA